MRLRAEIALLFATFMWGLTFPFIRIVLQEMTPLYLVFLRSAAATLLFLPFILFIKKNKENLFRLLPIGALLGILYFTSYLTQSIGLQTIPSGRSAFITNLSVIFVPLLSPIFKRGAPSQKDLISCLIAICGMFLLTEPFSNTGLNRGDLLTIICAICFSLQIHTLQWAMENKPFPTIYAFLQVFFILVFSLTFIPITQKSIYFFPTSPLSIFALLYLGIFGMVLTTWLQTRYQSYTSPERAAVIYIMEPIFACVFGFILLNESISLKNFLGGLLIILAVMWTYLHKFIKKICTKNIN